MTNVSDYVYPCPCGYYGDPIKPCTCAPSAVAKYQKRISGPLLDRIDIHVEVPRLEYQDLISKAGVAAQRLMLIQVNQAWLTVVTAPRSALWVSRWFAGKSE